MKLSEKALNLIGRNLLENRINASNEDDLKQNRRLRKPAVETQRRFNLRPRVKPPKAPVLPFRRNKPKS